MRGMAMSRYALALALAFYTYIGWGLATPLIIKLGQQMGPGFNPAFPVLLNGIGTFLSGVVMLFLMNFVPPRISAWPWSSWALMTLWPSGGLAFTLAIYFSPHGRESVVNAVAATYPIMSTLVLWYFFGEILSFQKAVWFLVTAAGVVGIILSK